MCVFYLLVSIEFYLFFKINFRTTDEREAEPEFQVRRASPRPSSVQRKRFSPAPPAAHSLSKVNKIEPIFIFSTTTTTRREKCWLTKKRKRKMFHSTFSRFPFGGLPRCGILMDSVAVVYTLGMCGGGDWICTRGFRFRREE